VKIGVFALSLLALAVAILIAISFGSEPVSQSRALSDAS
jgi:hypothetical protein